MASSSSRIPQGEVTMEFLDGGSYIKSNLDRAVDDLESQRSSKEEGLRAAKAMEALDVGKQSAGVKAEDVELISSQTGLSKQEAEEILKAERGDLVKALLKYIQPRPRARSVDGGAIPK